MTLSYIKPITSGSKNIHRTKYRRGEIIIITIVILCAADILLIGNLPLTDLDKPPKQYYSIRRRTTYMWLTRLQKVTSFLSCHRGDYYVSGPYCSRLRQNIISNTESSQYTQTYCFFLILYLPYIFRFWKRPSFLQMSHLCISVTKLYF